MFTRTDVDWSMACGFVDCRSARAAKRKIRNVLKANEITTTCWLNRETNVLIVLCFKPLKPGLSAYLQGLCSKEKLEATEEMIEAAMTWLKG